MMSLKCPGNWTLRSHCGPRRGGMGKQHGGGGGHGVQEEDRARLHSVLYKEKELGYDL